MGGRPARALRCVARHSTLRSLSSIPHMRGFAQLHWTSGRMTLEGGVQGREATHKTCPHAFILPENEWCPLPLVPSCALIIGCFDGTGNSRGITHTLLLFHAPAWTVESALSEVSNSVEPVLLVSMPPPSGPLGGFPLHESHCSSLIVPQLSRYNQQEAEECHSHPPSTARFLLELCFVPRIFLMARSPTISRLVPPSSTPRNVFVSLTSTDRSPEAAHFFSARIDPVGIPTSRALTDLVLSTTPSSSRFQLVLLLHRSTRHLLQHLPVPSFTRWRGLEGTEPGETDLRETELGGQDPLGRATHLQPLVRRSHSCAQAVACTTLAWEE